MVEALDPSTHRARVRLVGQDDVVSGWLAVLVPSTHGDRDFCLPPEGTQVAVLLDEHDEAGCILGALYSSADPPAIEDASVRRVDFGDGAIVLYDQGTHEMRVELPAGGVVRVGQDPVPVALAPFVDARIGALQEALDTHVHPTGVGPSGPTAAPVGPQESVAAEVLVAQ